MKFYLEYRTVPDIRYSLWRQDPSGATWSCVNFSGGANRAKLTDIVVESLLSSPENFQPNWTIKGFDSYEELVEYVIQNNMFDVLI